MLLNLFHTLCCAVSGHDPSASEIAPGSGKDGGFSGTELAADGKAPKEK